MLASLGMLEHEITIPEKKPIICSNSYWLRVNDGGVLRVYPQLVQRVKKGEEIATMYDIYGRKEIHYPSPEDGVVIGKNGDRILHLGIIE